MPIRSGDIQLLLSSGGDHRAIILVGTRTALPTS